jgi:hypothetical protein
LAAGRASGILPGMEDGMAREWARGKGLLLGPLAVQLATHGVETVVDLLEWARDGGVVPGQEGRPVPNGSAWARLYRRHRYVRDVVFESIPIFRAGSPLSWEIFDQLAELLTLAGNQPAALQAMSDAVVEDLRGRVKADKAAGGQGLVTDVIPEELALGQALAGFFANTGQDETEEVPGEDGVTLAAFGRLEVQFFFKVWLPCWWEYGDFAPRFMRLARLRFDDRALTVEERAAKLDAAVKLLRLDKGAICEPRIGELFADLNARGHTVSLTDLLEEYAKRPEKTLRRGRVKALLAALVVRLSEKGQAKLPVVLAAVPSRHHEMVRTWIGEKIEPKDMHALYDAIAEYEGRAGKWCEDPDLPLNSASWNQAVNREKVFWKFLDEPLQ